MRIVGICGSLQASSSNLTLLRSAASRLPDDVQFVLYDGLRDLPQFDPDIERDGASPAAVAELRQLLSGADALLIASPEYGHSLPGSLKNAIDWVIGTGEMESKIVGVTASVNHEMRGVRGLDALLRTLAAVSAKVIGGTPIVRGEHEEAELRSLVDALVAAVAAATGASAGESSTVAR